ncbi:NUDIX hydrolase [Fluviispira sanaruensis]|uniref:CoA pyrophosphatase n=1 Tax=Fluviispira sanaruensis TaxID=2493639 RepID=A0A4V0P2U2_FLUSA|nr:CoA pyrophosphatase [Fluviispira sanaruensis]BBH54417.1 CoA pyrophosphatase [Fluviispira sanaruensis]
MNQENILNIFQKIAKSTGLVEDIPEMHRRSSILIPIFCPETDWHNNSTDIKNWSLLFTIRSEKLKEHAGEIAFPGGRIEENEAPFQTALREAEEEIGLGKEQILSYFQLNNSFARSGYHIIPYCALISNDFKLKINKDEVNEVFFLTIQEILNLKSWSETRTLATFKREVWHYPIDIDDLGKFDIWGATGNILRDLMLRIEEHI